MKRGRWPVVALVGLWLVTAAIGATATGAQYQSNTALQSQLDATAASLATSQSALATAQQAFSQTSDALNASRAQLSADGSSISTYESEMAAQQSTISSQADQIGTLQGQVSGDQSTISSLQSQLASVEQGASTTISSGNLTWHITDLEGNKHNWQWPLDSYRQTVQSSHVPTYLSLQTDSGQTLTVASPMPFVAPSDFSGVVSDLTAGHTAQQFVREAFNVKAQFVVYAKTLVDNDGSYKFPTETMTEGTGVCGDTTILLASLIQAGNVQSNYGITVKVWIAYMDPNTGVLANHPTTINHALLEVDYKDGTHEVIETTTPSFSTHTEGFEGWSYNVA